MLTGTLINAVFLSLKRIFIKNDTMKKFISLMAAAFLAVGANAQIVVDSHFKPRTLGEMLSPLLMIQQFQQECLDKLESLLERTEQAEQFISKERDPATWRVYADCCNSIVNEYNSILRNGTGPSTRRVISDLRTRSSSLLTSIKSAYDRRNRLSGDQYARLRADDRLMCDRFFSDISLDEFMNGQTPTVTYQNREEFNATHP